MEEPNWIIIFPGATTPMLMASAPESSVPVITGVPSARPVSAAALAVTVPAMSLASLMAESWSGRQMGLHSSGLGVPSLL